MPAAQVQLPNDLQTFVKTNRPLVVILSVLLLLLGGTAVGYSFITRPTRTITVIGTGTKNIKPDQAVVAFSMLYENNTQQAAITGGEERFAILLASLKQFSIASLDTSPYQLTTRVSAGNTIYQYVNAARITIGNPDSINDVVKILYNNGATAVTQPRFVPKDEKQVDRELQQLAVEDATERARNMAKTAGARLGKVLTIQEGVSTGQTGSTVTGSAKSTGEANPAVAGNEIELQAQVTAIFELW